ncbi:SH3 domain-containing protein [Gluconobacter wancherniae]|uniref:SH3 domain-containing protein n=1 Tax=Gluconobacter wancherniae TaxID=1307955 RepID=UPI001B8C1C06|nr:SH3 domain-containing protein [Gluconobacter wancherniae]MBS1088198.1 hypothetical protein [Gluconobacter wancherniae]
MKTSVSFSRILCCGLVLPIAAGSLLAASSAKATPHHKHTHHDAAIAGAAKKATHPSPHGKEKQHAHGAPKPHHASPHHHAVSGRHAAVTGAAVAGAAAAGAAAAAPAAPATPALPPEAAPTDKGTNTGLPLPRYAALRADKVYMRRGPGDRYPIDWVYHRRGLPVEIEREFDVWRLVEDSDGQKGWVHQATLYGSRTFVIPGLPPEGATAQNGEASAQAGDHIGRADARVLGTVATQDEARAKKNMVLLMSHPEDDSSVVAVLEPGTVGNIKLCPQASQWCHVVVKGYDGWLPRRLFWGLLPGETIQPN